MPLGVITVDYGKHESIFEKLNPFVDKLVTAYKQKQLNEWDNEWMTMAIKDIENASDPDTINALMEKQNPPEGYIDIEGATSFATDAVGMLRRKEISQNTPQNGASMQNGDIFPDKMEFNELFAYVQSLPSGQVDWSNTLGLFKERLESKRKMGDAAQQFLNQILGQGIPDQRARFENDFNLSKNIMQTLYPETEQVDPIALAWDRAGKLPQDMRADFLRQQGIDIPEGDKLDYDLLNSFMKDNNLKIKTQTVNDKGEQSFTLEPIEDEYDLNSIASMIKEAEQAGINLKYTKDGLTMSAASETSNKPSSDYERWLADPEKFEEYKSIVSATTKKSRVNDILFGDTGIIPKFIKDETIDMGMPLTEEEKDVIVSNYKIRKPTLTSEEIAEIERYFMQIGVDPYAAKLPEPVPEKGETGVQWWNPFTWGQLEEENLGKGRDKYGYVIGEIKEANGKKYEYIGNNKWKPIS